MSDLATLFIRVDSSGVVTASKNLNELTGSAQKAEKATSSAAASAGKYITAAAATAAAMQLIKISVEAFMEAEKATLRMAMAMKNQGDFSRAALADMKEYAAQLQEITAYEDDATLSIMANLKSYGMTNAEVKKATKTAMDFASAKQAEGMTVSRAAELLGKAYAGNTATLSRYGIVIGDTKDKSEKFNAVMKQLEQRFGGSAQAELLTYAGQWQRLKNQWSNIQEFLGLVFLKTLQGVQVTIGLIATTFLTAGNAIIGILRAITSPLAVVLEGMAWLAQKAGQTGMADGMRAVANAAKNAQGNIVAAREDMLGWTSVAYDNFKTFDNIEQAVDKMGKTGKRTTYDLTNGTDGAANAAKRLKDEWDKTKKSLENELRLEGLTGARLEFEQTLIKYEELEKQVSALPPSLQKGAKAFIDLWKAEKDAATVSAAVADSSKSNADEMEKERQAVDRLTDAYQDLMNSLDPFAANEDKYKQSMSLLDKALEKGVITEPQHKSATESVKDEKAVLDANAYADFYSEIQGYEDEYRRKKYEAIEAEQRLRAKYYKDDVAAAKWAADEKAKLEYDLFKKKTDYLSQGFGDLSYAFEGISRMYAEGSEDAKRWQEAANAMLIAQKAVAVVQAVVAIATQGSGDPYTAFARIAAMAAAMGALLANIGESVGGGGVAAAAPKSYNYGGSAGPLGAETGTASESLMHSLELLQDTYDLEDTKLTKIYNELKDLNGNITGLVARIFQSGTMTSDYIGTVGSSYNPDMFGVSESNTGVGFFDNAVNWVQGKLFGEVTKSIAAVGIKTSDTSIKSLLNDITYSALNAAKYTIVKTEEDGGWFHSDHTSYQTITSTLDSRVNFLLNKAFQNMSSTLMMLTEELGTSVSDTMNYVFKGVELNLQNMSGEEATAAINEYFSKVGDEAVQTLFGSILREYQKINEGLLETAVRLVTDKETVMNVLSATGHGMEQITTSVTKTRQAITDEWTQWEADRIRWSHSFIGRITTAFGGSYRVPEPDKYYTQTYNEITSNAQALIELSESLIKLAGGLDKLTESAEGYYTAFYSEAQQITLLKGQLSGAFAELERAFPATRSGFRGVVEGLDLTTKAGRENYVAMLNMAESADKYYAYIEELASKRAEMEIDLLKLQGDAVGALAKERAGELEEMDASLKTFQQLIYAQEDFNDLLDKATGLLDQWRSMESDLLALQSDKVGALAVKRQDELDALDESLRPLQELIYAQEDLNNARTTEITAVNNLITAQGKVVSELQGYVDKLKSARESMKMEGMKFAAEQVVSARLAFNAVLGQARMGDLSGIGTVDNAMAKLIENANSPKAFQTKQQYEENYYRTYNDIAELEKLAGTQLSTEEQTLNTLKDQLKVLNQIAGNTDNADLSVQDAQNAVDLAHADVIAKQAALEQARAQYEATRQAFVTMEEVVNSINGNNSQLTMSISEMTTALLEAKQAVVDATAGWATYQANQTAADAAAEQARLDALSAKQAAEAQAAADALAAQQAADAKNAADALAEQQAAEARAAAKAAYLEDHPFLRLAVELRELFGGLFTSSNGTEVPGYASGGTFEGGYRLVGENGPEIEYTGPSQITSNASSKALLDNSEVVKELKSLREDIKAYGYAIAKNTGKSAKVSDRWDIDGLPAERTIT